MAYLPDWTEDLTTKKYLDEPGTGTCDGCKIHAQLEEGLCFVCWANAEKSDD